METEKIKYLAGGWNWKEKGGQRIFSEEALNFLQDVSQEIRRTPGLSENEEAAALSFWMRRRAMEQWKNQTDQKNRMGWGVIFHIAPSNIPMLFAYSMAIGMLAGNANVIRVSSRITESGRKLCEVIDRVMRQEKHQKIFQRNLILVYDKEEEITHKISMLCDGRVLWGGDRTADQFRKISVNPGSVELVFPDRSSIAVFDADWMGKRTEEEYRQLAYNFYNDTMRMDQNACSSPKVIFWIGTDPKQKEQVQKQWWNLFCQIARDYDITDSKAFEKYETVCEEIMNGDQIVSVKTYDNYVYLLNLKEYPKNPEQYRGKFGCFYQYSVEKWTDVCPCLNRKIQTIVYAGERPEELSKEIIHSGQKGGDRLVPVGQAMAFDRIWDGKDMIVQLSRKIDIK